jgi:hypothetical protein
MRVLPVGQSWVEKRCLRENPINDGINPLDIYDLCSKNPLSYSLGINIQRYEPAKHFVRIPLEKYVGWNSPGVLFLKEYVVKLSVITHYH